MWPVAVRASASSIDFLSRLAMTPSSVASGINLRKRARFPCTTWVWTIGPGAKAKTMARFWSIWTLHRVIDLLPASRPTCCRRKLCRSGRRACPGTWRRCDSGGGGTRPGGGRWLRRERLLVDVALAQRRYDPIQDLLAETRNNWQSAATIFQQTLA